MIQCIMLKFFLLFLILSSSLISSYSAHGNNDLVKKAWNTTSIKREDYWQYGHINKQNCLSSLKHFAGCFEAINFLASEVKKSTLSILFEMDSIGRVWIRTDFLPEESLASISQGIENSGEELSYIEQLEVIKDLNVKKREFYAQYFDVIQKLQNQNKEIMWPILDTIDALLDEAGKNQEKYLVANILNAYLKNAIDPHTAFAPFELLLSSIQNSHYSPPLINLGIKYNKTESGEYYIGEVTKGSLAEELGIQWGDQILSINGDILKPSDPLEIVLEKLKGVEGELKSIVLKRDSLTLAHLNFRLEKRTYTQFWSKFNSPYKNAYLKLGTFESEKSCELVTEELQKMLIQSPSSLTLDLRDNPGGLVDQVQCIGGLFLGNNIALFQKLSLRYPSYGKQIVYTSSEKIFPDDIPIIVLINGNTASSSEILIGALNDYQRAFIVGENSYGKGSMMSYKPLSWMPQDEILYQGTSHLYFSPLGYSIQNHGFSPHLYIASNLEESDPYMREEDEFLFPLENLNPYPVELQKAPSRFSQSFMDCFEQREDQVKALFKNKYHGIGDLQLFMSEEGLLSCLKP